MIYNCLYFVKWDNSHYDNFIQHSIYEKLYTYNVVVLKKKCILWCTIVNVHSPVVNHLNCPIHPEKYHCLFKLEY